MNRKLEPLSAEISTATCERIPRSRAVCFLARDEVGGASAPSALNPLVVATGDDGETLLHNMAMQGDAALVAVLIENGADVNAQSPKGMTPLARAVAMGHLNVVRALLDKKADPTLRESNGQTALHWLRKSDSAEAIAMAIVSRKADVNAQDEAGLTPVHFAAFRKIDAAINLYAKHGMDANSAGRSGVTPLHVAAISDECPENTAATILALQKHGADINAKDNDGDTPLDTAMRLDRTEAIAALVKLGGKRSKDM